MSHGVKLEERQTKTDDQNLVSQGEFIFVRKLGIGQDVKDVTFRAIEDGDKLRDARDLLNDRYGWRGYGSTHSIPSGVHHTTFTAEVDKSVVGTITLAIDSKCGLAVDQTFREDIDYIRQSEGSSICELTRLAFHSGVRSKEVLAGLFHFVFIYGTMISECTDLLIEINPRHAYFYETMLGFERIGSLKTNGSVAAPSQLMRLKVDAIRRSISELGGSANRASHRSLYYNFFPPLQETQIRCLLSSNPTMRYNRHDSLSVQRSFSGFAGEALSLSGSMDSAAPTAARDIAVMPSSRVRQAA